MRAALKTLQFVEKDTIRPDVSSHEVTFGVTDPALFDEQAVKDALAAKGFHEVKVKSGPT